MTSLRKPDKQGVSEVSPTILFSSVTENPVEKGTGKMNMKQGVGMDYTILSLGFNKKQVFDGVFFYPSDAWLHWSR